MESPGVFSAISKGTAVVSMTYKLLNATSRVTVSNVEVQKIGISETDLTMLIDHTHRLTAPIYPDNATEKSVVWRTLDESVATVNASGLVTAVGEGSTVIVVTSLDNSEIEARCKVTVQLPPPMDFDIEEPLFGGDVTQVEYQDHIRAELESKTPGQDIVHFSVKSLDQRIVGVRRDDSNSIEITGLSVGKAEIEVQVTDKYGRKIPKVFPVEVKMVLPFFTLQVTIGGNATFKSGKEGITLKNVEISLHRYGGAPVIVNSIVVLGDADDGYRGVYFAKTIGKEISPDSPVSIVVSVEKVINPVLRVEMVREGQLFYFYNPLFSSGDKVLVEGPKL